MFNTLSYFLIILINVSSITIPVVQQFQEYVEPEEGVNPAPRRGGKDEEKVLLPLGETTLTNNLGIPLVVVLTKVIPIESCLIEISFFRIYIVLDSCSIYNASDCNYC